MKCTKCSSKKVTKKGKSGGKQRYLCLECGVKFSENNKQKIDFNKCLDEYIFEKQVLRELEEVYHITRKKFRALLKAFIPPEKIHNPRSINLITDATYFGKRKDKSSWGVLLARDAKEKEDLRWLFLEKETKEAYLLSRLELEKHGYKILSVTADGFPTLPSIYNDIPFQTCLFHISKMIVRGVTRSPKTEAGRELLELSYRIHEIQKSEFEIWLHTFIETYRDFLNEKTTLPSGRSFSTHKKINSVIHTLTNSLPYLFMYQKYPELNIPKTSNSIESHFSHIKDILRIHRGLSRAIKEKILHMIFMNSSIVKKRK